MNNNVGYMQKLGRVRNVGLGTDGIRANMFEEAKLHSSKIQTCGGTLTPNDILRFLQNGNDLLGALLNLKFGKN